MVLQDLSLENVNRLPVVPHSKLDTCLLEAARPTAPNPQDMKARTRSQADSPRDPIRLRAWKLDSPSAPDAPQLTLAEDVAQSLDMAQANGLIREQPSPDQRSLSTRFGGPSNVRSATFLSSSEHSVSPEPQVWSSAVGHASTGKSGRVIERLQNDIDRLRREQHALKLQYEQSEKDREILASRNQLLQDRNRNFEQSHEASIRQLARKDRQLEDVREELRKEKEKRARAEEAAQVSATSEESWKDQAHLAQSIAAQKESEYETIVTCRNGDNDRYQTAVDKMRDGFQALLRQRESDLDKQRQLEIIAEQQKQTISKLEEVTKRLGINFKSYRGEIDIAISEMQEVASSNDVAIVSKLEEMKRVTDNMRWVMNMEKLVKPNAL